MVKTSPRELVSVPPEWSITQLMRVLKAALDGDGPALAFGPSKFQQVNPDIAVVIPTSGSTGAPKEVALSAMALRASARAAHQFIGAKPLDRWSLLLPINHIAGVNVLVRALELNSEVIDLRKSMDYVDADFTSIVPTQLYRAINGEKELLAHLQKMKTVLVGGSATSELLKKDAQANGIHVVTTYGMSEMSGGCIYNNQPLAGVDVEIDSIGRIALKGPMQATTYLGDAETWQMNKLNDWFLTSDLGKIVEGKLFVEGRIDDQIISGGEKISLTVLEEILTEKFPTSSFMACAVTDPEWGQALCLASKTILNQAEIKEFLRVRLGAYAVPKYFLDEVEFPFTTIGKPDRLTLAKKFERSYK